VCNRNLPQARSASRSVLTWHVNLWLRRAYLDRRPIAIGIWLFLPSTCLVVLVVATAEHVCHCQRFSRNQKGHLASVLPRPGACCTARHCTVPACMPYHTLLSRWEHAGPEGLLGQPGPRLAYAALHFFSLVLRATTLDTLQ